MKTYIPTFSLLTLMVLTACDIRFTSLSSGDSSTASSSSSVATTSTTPNSNAGDGYFKAVESAISQQEYNTAADLFTMPTRGDQKLLVIPVTFTDYRCNSLCASRKTEIQKAFFGASNETSWESVASFYEKSSYGALTLTGTVTDWYHSSYSSAQFAALDSSSYTGDYPEYYDPTWTMLNEAVAWYRSTSGNNLQEFDSDDDGFIDAVYLIYNRPYETSGDGPYWAYTYWNYGNYSLDSVTNPVGMTYCWSSYAFMDEGYGTSGIDAHTYIHEFGHAFGLDDYYTYDADDWGALGGIDMMDYNIVDHNPFSKFLLGWATPYVIDGTANTTTITLNPFVTSGDFILINNGWNDSVFDEYLMVEFYAPIGLNQQDSEQPYGGNGLQGFTVPGIKISHVDARLGQFSSASGNFIDYTDSLVVGSGYYPYITASNTASYSSADSEHKLIHLLEEGGSNTFKNGSFATDASLFKQGDRFTPNAYASFFPNPGKFNDDSSIGYAIDVTSVSLTSATLTISKL